MIFFMFIIYFQVTIKTIIKFVSNTKTIFSSIPEFSVIMWTIYTSLVMSSFYTNTTLPYGRFYNRISGNPALLYAYLIVFIYLSVNTYKYINKLYINKNSN